MRWLLALVLAALQIPLQAQAAEVPVPVWRAYRQAIRDARTPGDDEVVNTLVPLTRHDPRVQWRVIDGQRYVLVVTLRRNTLADAGPGQPFTLTSDKWVALPRQMRNRCARLGCARMTDARLDLTLKQFLGVPPDGDYHVVNTFWARPRDMFRPCRQPDVRLTSCPRRAPQVLPTIRGVPVQRFLREQAAYAWRMPRRWDPRTATSCASAYPEPRNCYGFPWTRLGYTYDWAPRRNHIGLTEFVVAEGATVFPAKVQTQRAFIER